MEPLSRDVLIAQGKCCGNGCELCPYYPRYSKGSVKIFVTPYDVSCRPSCSINTMRDGLCMCHLDFIENKNK